MSTEKTIRLANSILENIDNVEKLDKKLNETLDKIGELSYKQQLLQRDLSKIYSDLDSKEQILKALSLAKLTLLERQEEEDKKEKEGNEHVE